jgi:hypothetical protein
MLGKWEELLETTLAARKSALAVTNQQDTDNVTRIINQVVRPILVPRGRVFVVG